MQERKVSKTEELQVDTLQDTVSYGPQRGLEGTATHRFPSWSVLPAKRAAGPQPLLEGRKVKDPGGGLSRAGSLRAAVRSHGFT